MTKIMVDLNNPENRELYRVDGVILSDPDFSLYPGRTYNRAEMERLVTDCKKRGIMIIVNIDKIIEEDELNALEDALAFYFRLGVDFYLYSDFAVLSYFTERKATHRLIYDPKTLITNYQDAKIHQNWGSFVVISNEISRSEMEKLVAVGNVVLEVYGHRRLFYSRRHLLTTFGKYAHLHLAEKTAYTLREEFRDDYYLIYQSLPGTLVYTDYRIAFFRELAELSPPPAFLRINGAFVPEKELVSIVALYRTLLEKPDWADRLYKKMKEIYPHLGTGYLAASNLYEGDNL